MTSTRERALSAIIKEQHGHEFGLTRLSMQMLGQENVREVTFHYRGPQRLEP